MAARAASSSSIGTTIPGRTIGSLTKRTGTTLDVVVFSDINPPKLNLVGSTLGGTPLFPLSAGPAPVPERRGHQHGYQGQRDHRVHTLRDVDGQREDDREADQHTDEQGDAPHR